MDVSSAIEKINQLEMSVRDHINTHRYQADLLRDSNTWNQVCSSLDTIGDSVYAISSYVESEFPSDTGLRYIYTYGILQALFIQQDALRHLSEALGIEFRISSELTNIRNTRNASIGHPTKQDHKGVRYYNYISRISMSKGGFDLLRHPENRPYELVRANILAAITEQLAAVVDGYSKINGRLKEMDEVHKQQFRQQPLSEIFPSSMGYHFEKIGQGIYAYSKGDREFGHTNLKMLREVYESFKAGLEARNELSEYVAYDLNEYLHAISRLDEYLSGNVPQMQEADARIYYGYLYSRHPSFLGLAKEIDEEYAGEA